MVVNSLKGTEKKMERKKETGKRYKSGEDSLDERIRKKLTESTTWYKDKIVDEDAKGEPPKESHYKWRKYRERKV